MLTYDWTKNGGQVTYWLKLTRSGDTFSSYQSVDGQNWVQVGSSQTITMVRTCISAWR